MADRDLKDVAADLDVIATWYGTGSNQYRRIKALADEVAAAAGGRKELAPGDPSLPTPGPGVKTPVEVDSVGAIEDKPATPAPKPPLGQLGDKPSN